MWSADITAFNKGLEMVKNILKTKLVVVYRRRQGASVKKEMSDA